MRRYDYSFIKDIRIRADTVGLTKGIEAFRIREEDRKKSNREAFTALESIARIQSIKGSNEIEGIVTTDRRIEEIVNKNSAPLNHSEMEIAGYRDVLDTVHKEHMSMDLSEGLILDMHRMMMSYTPNGGGRYKTSDNVIMEVDQHGARRVRFRPTPSEETKEAMEQLILAYVDAKDDSSIDPIFLIPCVILDFLCIHPFPDGNGRMSRLLSLLLMYRNGIDVGKYISFEGQINEHKGSYYESLRASSDGWHDNSNDYLPFIENFIFTLFVCYRELERRFDVVGEKKANKGNRIEAAVKNSVPSISKKEIMELLPDISQATIEAKLSELQKQGRVRKTGSYKDAKYVWIR
ncbi:MAG: Fic family protein [Methanomassiliicoccaceae archaeon]|nr:Fic family protein [Methanomassiliicoccaceae archaeon]